MQSSHRGLTTAMHSVVNIACVQLIHNSAARLILRRPCSDSARPCYKNFIGCPWHAQSISRHWYLHTKPFTTERQCICVNSCAHINRQEHCALPAVTVWKWSALVPRLGAARSQWLRRLCGTLYPTLLKPVTLSPASFVSLISVYCRWTLPSTHSNLIMTIPVILFIFNIIFYHLNYYFIKLFYCY